MPNAKIHVRAPFNYDPDRASLDAGLACPEPTRTIQSQGPEADINSIVNRFNLTGEIPVTSRQPFPVDIDFDEIADYRALLDAQRGAALAFNSLPARVRERFANDPTAFCDFATAPENLATLREWGLAPPAPEPAPEPSPSA